MPVSTSTEARTLPGIDARWIAQTFAFRRTVTQPRDVTPKWMMAGQMYGSVLRDKQDNWRMWYLDDPVYTEHFATSTDGIHWHKPDLALGLVDAKTGPTKPNAIMTSPSKDLAGNWLSGVQGPEGFCVLDNELTPHPAAQARFTALYLARWFESPTDVKRGLCIVFSDDGIHWRSNGKNPVIPGWLDTGNIFFYDTKIKRYVVYGRPNACIDRVTHANRLIARCESEDLINWTAFQTVLDCDDQDADPMEFIDEAALRAGGNVTKAQQAAAWQHLTEGANKTEKPLIRGRNKQWYGMTVFPYADLYIGIAKMYDVPSGKSWLELLHSYDGVDWRREHGRKPWIGHSPARWDYPMQVPGASPPVQVNDELWYYYSATAKTHHGVTNELTDTNTGEVQPLRAIGACAIKTDRWVGYVCQDREAELLTQTLTRPGKITLNAEIKPGGRLRVEACDRLGVALPGYELDKCKPITGEGLKLSVEWESGSSVDAQEVRLRIIGNNSTVYAVGMG